MTTTCNTVFGKDTLRLGRKRSFRILTGIMALFLAAALVPGYAYDAKNAQKTSSSKKQSEAGREEYTKGMAAFEKKDYKEAARLFRAGAENGDTDAMVMLAYCLENAKGVKKDLNESKNWYKKAADAGNALAQAMYGIDRLEVSEKEGIAYLKKSADQDCVFGQYFLGVYFLQEGNPKTRIEEGVKYSKKAAAHSFTDTKNVLDCVKEDDEDDQAAVFGFPPETTATNMCIALSQFILGSTYLQGKIVEQDFAEARKWLSLAKKNGIALADDLLKQLDLLEKKKASAKGNAKSGGLEAEQKEFRDGIAAYDRKEFGEAVKLFRAGAEKGGAEAQMMLAYCLEYGIGIEKDEKEAEKWMKKAADAGNAVAQLMYGTRLLEDNAEEAVGYLEKSAERGYVNGQLGLASVYLRKDDGASQAIGVAYVMKIAALPQTNEKTIEDYLLDDEDRSHFDRDVSAANATILLAQYLAGEICLRGGGGVKKDLDEAEKWFRKAADGGLIMAKEALEILEARK